MKDLKKRYSHALYSLRHIVCINKLAAKLGVWKPKYLLHDMDKVFMYLFCTGKTVKEIHQAHRAKSTHHVEYFEQKKMDWEMAVLDWESARFTKPDKPLNAHDTLRTHYPQFAEYCMPIIEKLGLI